MRKRWMGTAVAVLMAGVLLGAVPASARPTSPQVTDGKAKVKIKNFSFNPTPLTITAGTVVVWVNTTPMTTHTTTSDAAKWDSGPLAAGARYKHRFKKVGTFTYHCSIHPTMKAEIDVTP